MKNIRLVCAGLVAMLLVSSCGMMSDGFSGSSIQKRKYTNGFYFSKNKHYRGAEKNSVADEKVQSEEAVAEEIIVSNSELTQNVSTQEEQVQVTSNKNPTPVQKDEDKSKENKRKSGATPSKKSPAPQKQRKERVPEHYLPIKKDASESRSNSNSSSSSSDDMFILAVIFAILIPPIGVAIYTSIDWTKVLICLLLTILFFLPGMIYALLVVFDAI